MTDTPVFESVQSATRLAMVRAAAARVFAGVLPDVDVEAYATRLEALKTRDELRDLANRCAVPAWGRKHAIAVRLVNAGVIA